MTVFRCFDPSADGRGGIHAWYNQLDPAFRAEIDSVMELLSLEDKLVDLPEIKDLRGACDKLTEIKIDFSYKHRKINLRILGFRGPAKGEFTLLSGFQKANNNAPYGPECRKANERMNGVLRDGNRAPPCGFP